MPEWMERAVCSGEDVNLFFPQRGAGTQAARKICQSCDVKVECEDYRASTESDQGVWAGRLVERRRGPRRGGAAPD